MSEIYGGTAAPSGWAGSHRVVGQRTRFLARFRRAQGRLGKFDLRADGREAELDCRQTGDAQRCKREPTSPPVPCPEIQVTTRFKSVSPVCHNLLTDPYFYFHIVARTGLPRNQTAIHHLFLAF
jgi:hypothetical protein